MTQPGVSSADKRRAEAAAWRVRLETDPALERSVDYVEWLADPENRAMAERARASWDLVGEFSASPEMIAVRQEALADARRASRSGLAGRGVAQGRWIVGAVAAGAIAAGAVFLAPMVFPQVYETGVGERRIVILHDGSRLSLDADSEVRVRLLADARKLDLLRGQARFEVAHDADRPFSVRARDRVVLATGTDFNVNLLGKSLLVTLVEGRVVVSEEGGSAPTPLNAGQQMTLNRGEKPVVRTADLKGVIAWESGQLVFDDEPLTTAVLRVNRYAQREIVVGHSVSGVRVSGAFDARDTKAFLNAMTAYFGLDAVERDGKIILQPKAR